MVIDMLIMLIVSMVSCFTYVKTYHVVHTKIQLIVCYLHSNTAIFFLKKDLFGVEK